MPRPPEDAPTSEQVRAGLTEGLTRMLWLCLGVLLGVALTLLSVTSIGAALPGSGWGLSLDLGDATYGALLASVLWSVFAFKLIHDQSFEAIEKFYISAHLAAMSELAEAADLDMSEYNEIARPYIDRTNRLTQLTIGSDPSLRADVWIRKRLGIAPFTDLPPDADPFGDPEQNSD